MFYTEIVMLWAVSVIHMTEDDTTVSAVVTISCIMFVRKKLQVILILQQRIAVIEWEKHVIKDGIY